MHSLIRRCCCGTFPISGLLQLSRGFDSIGYYQFVLFFILVGLCIMPGVPGSIKTVDSRSHLVLKYCVFWRSPSKLVRVKLNISFSCHSNSDTPSHLIRLNVLAVCILSLFVTTAIEKNYDPLDQALLSIVCGFLARIQLILPRSPIFVEVSGLVNSLLQ